MDEGDVVDAGGQVREQRGNPLAALAVLGKFPTRLDDAALILVSAAAERLHLDGLVVHALHGGLIVKRIDVARTAIHVQKNHTFGLRRKMRSASGKRIGPGGEAIGGDRLMGQEPIISQECRQRRACKTGPSLPKELAPRAATEVSACALAIHGFAFFAQSRYTNSFRLYAATQNCLSTTSGDNLCFVCNDASNFNPRAISPRVGSRWNKRAQRQRYLHSWFSPARSQR